MNYAFPKWIEPMSEHELWFFLNIDDLCMSMKPCLFLKIKAYVRPWPMLFHESREPMFDHNYACFLKIKNLCVTGKQTKLYHTSFTEPPKCYKRKMHACINLHPYKKASQIHTMFGWDCRAHSRATWEAFLPIRRIK